MLHKSLSGNWTKMFPLFPCVRYWSSISFATEITLFLRTLVIKFRTNEILIS